MRRALRAYAERRNTEAERGCSLPSRNASASSEIVGETHGGRLASRGRPLRDAKACAPRALANIGILDRRAQGHAVPHRDAFRCCASELQCQRHVTNSRTSPESPPVALFSLVDTLHSRVETLQKAAEVNLLKRVVGRDEDRAPMSRVKAPNLKPFGARSAKELENFLWDMETYFQVARILEAEKVSITSIYLTGDVKLWWCTRLSDDSSVNRDKIETWDILKKELKDQFLPCNTSWLARESIRKLKHAGIVRDYTWAQTELRRQSVKDLPFAIAAADRLVHIQVPNNCDLEKKKKDSSKEKGKSSKGWKDGKFKKKKHQEVTGSENNETVQPNVDRTKKGCYLCNGDHRMRDCPKRGKLNALVAETDDDEGGSTRVNPLQLVSALQERPAKHKGLMYLRVQINGKAVMAMLDSGATHNFVANREIQKWD
ncbi:hypothetical protein Sango_2915400 [Sesamum angolense]|uniref:Retrotransposon gag domain-containing protein n=1 Tax=Sesamum angolense TaxID=2727404 RepID=A0AAE1T4C5_9LAMI|nr:hypothetical protein Sango_2915400 [Sesamum angolense]